MEEVKVDTRIIQKSMINTFDCQLYLEQLRLFGMNLFMSIK